MRIKFSSWHYRLLDAYDATKPKSLCWYFWKVVLYLLVSMALAACVAILIFLAFISPFFAFQDIFWLSPPLLIWSVVLLLYALNAREDDDHWGNRTLWSLPEREPNPEENLLSEYIKAAKQKVCPILEYVDE